MEAVKNYYATALYFMPSNSGSVPEPSKHRYFVFVEFDEKTIGLINENTLEGNWTLKCGRRERYKFERRGVSHGPELSQLSEYIGQRYLRTPEQKTFIISKTEFLDQMRYR